MCIICMCGCMDMGYVSYFAFVKMFIGVCMMERRKVDILCFSETKCKKRKAHRLAAGSSCLIMVDGKRNKGEILKEEFSKIFRR